MNHDEIRALMGLARENRATHVKFVGKESEIEFSLSYDGSSAPTTEKSRLPESLAPRCLCGHAKYDHRGDVGCIHGCAPQRCIPNPPDPKE